MTTSAAPLISVLSPTGVYRLGTAGQDTLDSTTGDDTLDGAAGTDTASYATATAGVTVSLSLSGVQDTEGAGLDLLLNFENLLGSAFDDTLTGNAAANVLDGGAGADVMMGRNGNDTYVVDDEGDAVVETSRTGGTDTVRSQLASYTLTTYVENGWVLRTEGASLRGNSLGNALNGAVGHDTLDGGAGNDTLSGGAGNDLLLGGAGQDVLIVDGGTDTLDGGAVTDRLNYTDGNSLVIASSATSGVVVDLSGITGDGSTGTGTVRDAWGQVDTVANVNFLTGSAFADRFLGSTAATFEMFEGGLGDDTLDGGLISDRYGASAANRASYSQASGAVQASLATGQATGAAGNDTLLNINQLRGSAHGDVLTGSNATEWTESFEGRAGNDTIDGLGGKDMVRYDAATTGVVVNLATGTASDGQGGTDTLRNLEGVFGSAFADRLTGGLAANGSGLTDGFEFFRGGAGNDTLDGGTGYDRADYTAAGTGVVVRLGGSGNGTASDGQGGTDTLISIEAVRGSVYADRLTGSGRNTYGTDGYFESFEGLEGNDTLDGAGGAVRADYQSSLAAVEVDLAGGWARDGFGSTDTLIGIRGLRGSAYNDRLTGDGSSNTFYGANGNDTLAGGAGNDTLRGEAGQDVILLEAGTDSLDGGLVTDRLNYTDGNSLVASAAAPAGIVVDLSGITGDGSVGTGTVQDGWGQTDTVANFTFFTGSGQADRFLGSTAAIFEMFEGGAGNDTIDGGLISDRYGASSANRASYSQASGAVQASLATGQVTGAAGNDTLLNINQLRGSAYGDVLTGSNATEWTEAFEGRAGNDTIDGLGGKDFVRYDAATVGVQVDLAAGVAADGQGGVDTLRNLEGAWGSAYGDLLKGGAAANGSGLMDGFEFFRGGAGNDTLVGGTGYDRADYTNSAMGVVVRLDGSFSGGTSLAGTTPVPGEWGRGVAQDGMGGTDTLVGIEAVRGSVHGDRLMGSGRATYFTDGYFESLEGLEGNDTLDGAGGSVRADYQSSLTGVVVDLQAGTASDGLGGTDTLIAVGGVRGSAHDDQLTGSAGRNTLDGGAGNDTLTGGDGSDTYSVRDAGDVVVETQANSATGGVDLVQSYLADYTLTAQVEQGKVMLAGSARLTGNALNNLLTGNAGHDTLTGGAGNDTLVGGAGNDIYQVNNAGDVVSETDATASGGVDLVLSSLTAYTLAANVEQGRITASVHANLTGNGLNNLLGASTLNNVLDGGTGSDTVSYLWGTTAGQGVTVSLAVTTAQATGGSGSDTLIGIENLIGSAGADRLSGDTAANVLTGGAGRDTLTGGAGNDVFVLTGLGDSGNTATTRDLITDFTRGQDRIDLSAIDANRATTANEAFSATLVSAFTAAGQLKLVGNVLYGNTDSNYSTAEFAIELTGITVLTGPDFIL